MIIGFSGNNGSGKDTFSNMVKHEFATHGKRAITIAFADALYSTCCCLFRTYPKAICDAQPELKERILPHLGGKSTRDILIEFATVSRNIYPEVWTEIVKSKIRSENADFIILTDVRFANEAELADRLFQLCRDGYNENIGNCYGVPILNNGTLEDLQIRANTFVEWLLTKL